MASCWWGHRTKRWQQEDRHAVVPPSWECINMASNSPFPKGTKICVQQQRYKNIFESAVQEHRWHGDMPAWLGKGKNKGKSSEMWHVTENMRLKSTLEGKMWSTWLSVHRFMYPSFRCNKINQHTQTVTTQKRYFCCMKQKCQNSFANLYRYDTNAKCWAC